MKYYKAATILLMSMLINSMSNASTEPVTYKYGIGVKWCGFDYDKVDFCTDKKMKSYANILKTRSPNFDKDKIIYIFEEDKKLMDEPDPNIDKYYRVVLIDSKTKLVTPANFGITEARKYDGKLISVNNKNESLEFDFNKNSNKFCFKGNWNQYRAGASYHGEAFCFNYTSYGNEDKEFQFDVKPQSEL